MYTSLEWLNQLVNAKTIKLESLINKLTLGGFEVEEILKLNINNRDQTILDISATANRADSLSIKGIAKEITALLDQSTLKSSYSHSNLKYKQTFLDTFSSINSETDYSTFLTISIENLTDFTIPKWLNHKLKCSKVEPSNTLLDFQTYVLLETGYPFEFYDLDKIETFLQTSEFNLHLKTPTTTTEIVATNGIKYELNSDVLVLEANDYTLGIGGISPNREVMYTTSTRRLLVEGSIFASKKIRQQSRSLGLRTDRSARYEKGLNNSYFIDALIRLIQLLRITNPQLICKIHTSSEVEQVPSPRITLNYKNVIEILGPVQQNESRELGYILPNQIGGYLQRLNFDFTFNEQKLEWIVTIPKARIDDLEREIDLIEEIGRLHGFNNFITNLPHVENIGKEDFSYQIRKKLTHCLINEGLNELVQYSLVHETKENTISIINPLTMDCSTLRTTLLTNLIEIVSNNLKQNNGILEGFEYGHVFSGDLKSQYVEKEMVAGIFGGMKFKRQWDQTLQTMTWFEGKGKIEDLFRKLDIPIFWKSPILNNYKTLLHPYRTAELWISDVQYLGVFGQVHPALAKTSNVPTDIFLFEFNLDLIKEKFYSKRLALYEPYGTYPKMTKDLSFVIDRSVTFGQIQQTLLNNKSKYLKTVCLLDEYKGTALLDNQTSLCIQLTFQSMEKTLVTKEIDEIVNELQSVLENKYNVTIRH